MEPKDAIDLLAHQTRELRDLIDEKGRLWDDQGGRTTLHEYLHPQGEAAEDLVSALREQCKLLVAFEAEMATVERELEAAAIAHAETDAALARVRYDIRSADEQLTEVLHDEAEVAELEARAVRFADLANDCPREPEIEAAREKRQVELDSLQRAYPSLGVGHILEGEVNPAGKFTGCHSHRSVIGMVLTSETPDAKGVYYASVAGWSPAEKVIIKTVPHHSMFPDSWTEDQICREVLSAFVAKEPKELAKDGSWKGTSHSRVQIMGHVRDGSILAYPWRKDVD